jgi:hypothetical protein
MKEEVITLNQYPTMYGMGYQPYGYSIPAYPQSQPMLPPVKGTKQKAYHSSTIGNICGYTSNAPGVYNKLKVSHWPSQDYTIPHPGGFSHTIHQKQYLPTYEPHR